MENLNLESNEEYQNAYNLGCKMIYNLIMRDYRSVQNHRDRKFNPTIFLRRAAKMPAICSVVNPMLLLEQMEANGFLLRCKTADYTRVMFQITQTYCDYLQSISLFKIAMPEFNVEQKRINRKQKQMENAQYVVDEIKENTDKELEKEKDIYGIMELRKKIEKGDSHLTAKIKSPLKFDT